MPSNQSNQILPEPAYKLRVNGVFQDPIPTALAFGLPDGEHNLFTEQQVLALLANSGQMQTDARDAARLDWLDAQVKCHPVYNGYTWQEAGYEDNRGLVCAIQKPKQKLTARQAIDAAIAAAKEE